jgi:LPS sulfotransferase NodH
MMHFYQNLDRDHFNYQLQTLPGIREHSFRGPKIDPSQPYFACIGGAQTFGRFCDRPYSSLLSESLGIQALNLGVGGAGPRLFHTAEFLNWLNRSEFVIVQIMSGRSESNSLFVNSKGGVRGVTLREGREMRFEEFFRELRNSAPKELVESIIKETIENYRTSFLELLGHISRPKLLLWFAQRTPESYEGLLGTFPHLIKTETVDLLKSKCADFIQYASSTGLPQSLWLAERRIDGTQLKEDMLVNVYYPSPQMHAEAAELLAPACRRILQKIPASWRAERRQKIGSEPAGSGVEPLLHVIVAAERTGTNLFRQLLASHPKIMTGGELFNRVLMEKSQIPWGFDLGPRVPEFEELRRTNPPAFVQALFEMTARRGYQAIGFKLMYGHGDNCPGVLDYLVQDRTIRILHVKRRNLLRRLLSEEIARKTGVWWVGNSEAGPPPTKVRLDIKHCVSNFELIRAQQSKYDTLFGNHTKSDFFYEEMVAAPSATMAQGIRFLGLQPPAVEPRIISRKTGAGPLRDSIENYEELKEVFAGWSAFFEE